MPLDLAVTANHDAEGHHYRVVQPRDPEAFLDEVAGEYERLRTECAAPLADLSLDGIDVMELDGLRNRLREATIPPRRGGPFDVLRADFGEVAAYMLLEQEYATRFGYKGVRDRELARQPGRGIDLVGVEDGEVLVLALGEVKVSDENASPPQVVDRSADSLRNQHLGHLGDRTATASKILDASRRVTDTHLRDLLMTAAVVFESGDLDRLRVVACCVLVRSRERHQVADFGSFRASPDDYDPAGIRFWIICTPEGIEPTIDSWSELLEASSGGEP